MSRKKKVNDEVLQMIIKCARREISESEAARKANVGHTTMEQWVMQYTTEGITAFTYEHNNSYSKELNLAAITDYLSGKGSLLEICAKYKIRDKKQLREWISFFMTVLCWQRRPLSEVCSHTQNMTWSGGTQQIIFLS